MKLLLFTISITVFLVTLTGFVITLGLWIYSDAKIRTEKPKAWTLIVLLVPYFMGLIIYLAVGRNKKKSPGRFRKIFIIFAVGFLLSSVLLMGSFFALDGINLPTWNGISIGLVETFINNQWNLSFKTSGAEFTRTIEMSADELAALRITGNCDAGLLYFRVSQGEIVKIFDISNSFDEIIDMNDFHAGMIRMSVYNDNAKNARITVTWRIR